MERTTDYTVVHLPASLLSVNCALAGVNFLILQPEKCNAHQQVVLHRSVNCGKRSFTPPGHSPPVVHHPVFHPPVNHPPRSITPRSITPLPITPLFYIYFALFHKRTLSINQIKHVIIIIQYSTNTATRSNPKTRVLNRGQDQSNPLKQLRVERLAMEVKIANEKRYVLS